MMNKTFNYYLYVEIIQDGWLQDGFMMDHSLEMTTQNFRFCL